MDADELKILQEERKKLLLFVEDVSKLNRQTAMHNWDLIRSLAQGLLKLIEDNKHAKEHRAGPQTLP